MNNCKECIYDSFPKIPQSEIKQCDIAIVGESPGDTEIAFKKPFIGPSGELLEDIMNQVRLPDRQELFITNALLCRPPIGEIIKKDAIVNCRKRLISELQEVKPKYVLALGNIATHSITNNFDLKITGANGKILRSPYLNGTKVMPIVHPAAVLRNPGHKPPFLAAFKYLKTLLDGGKTLKPSKVHYTIIDDEFSLVMTLNYLSKNYQGKILGCDIETKGLSPFSGKTLYIGIAYEDDAVLMFTADKLFNSEVRKFFADPNMVFSWHNGQFDTGHLNALGVPARIDQDSMILHYATNEHEGYHDLDTLSMRELGADLYSYKIKSFIERMDEAPRYLWGIYLAKDCSYTKQLTEKFLPKIEKDNKLNPLYKQILIPAANMLREVQWNGFYLHRDYCIEYRDILKKEIVELQNKLDNQFKAYWDPEKYRVQAGAMSAPAKFNPGSFKQLGWMIYDRLELNPSVRKETNNGKSVDKEVLESLKGKHDAIDNLLLFRSKKKTLSTYVNGALHHADRDNRIRSQFWLTRTTSGRLASRKPNLQNIDRKSKVKNMFGAPPGGIIIEADYKGVELRVLAHLAHDSYFTKVFQEGRDPHDEMSRDIYGEAFTKEQRVKVKGLNFGAAYGRGAESVALEFGMSIGEARFLIDKWFRRAKGAKHFMDKVEEYLMDGKIFVTPFGRKRRFGNIARYIKDPELLAHIKKEARNFPIQSTASDLTLLAALEIHNTLVKKYNAMIVNMVHDSIIIEIDNKKSVVLPFIKEMKNIMEGIPHKYLKPHFTFPAEFEVGTHWGEMTEVEI